MRKSTIWYLMDPGEGLYHLIADVLKFGAFKLLLLGAGHQAECEQICGFEGHTSSGSSQKEMLLIAMPLFCSTPAVS